MLNGERLVVEPPVTLLSLVERIGAHPEAVAVAVGGVVIPRRQHGLVEVAEGDRIEVIRAVGGG